MCLFSLVPPSAHDRIVDQANDPWKVRILPRVAFGVHPAGIDGLTPDAKEIVVMHHFLGSWKKRGGWHKRRSVLQVLAGVIAAALQRRHEAAATEEPITPSVLPLFPVSAAFSPPFTIMTHLIGQGDMQVSQGGMQGWAGAAGGG